jgi:hypothetical protein
MTSKQRMNLPCYAVLKESHLTNKVEMKVVQIARFAHTSKKSNKVKRKNKTSAALFFWLTASAQSYAGCGSNSPFSILPS